MFPVGGGIIVHGVASLHHMIEHFASGRGAVVAAILPTLLNLVLGFIVGLIVVAVVKLVEKYAEIALIIADPGCKKTIPRLN